MPPSRVLAAPVDRWLRTSTTEYPMNNSGVVRRYTTSLFVLAKMIRLNIKEAGFDRGGSSQPPKETGEPQHKFSFHSRLRVVICRRGGFERAVIFSVFKRTDHGLSHQTVTHRIAARTLF